MNFKSFDLHPIILSNLHVLGYVTPTQIQSDSIPHILLGKDVMGLAQTGTGKTAAFVLPILHRLMQDNRCGLRALIIVPTRELAQQIHGVIGELSKGTKLRSVMVFGGVKIYPQIKNLKRSPEIVVACPGRLLDHLQNHRLDLSTVEMLVLDEADQMFDMGFLPDISRILRYLPKKRQTLLFSATMPDVLHDLAHNVLYKPIKIKVGRSAPAASVEHTLFPVSQDRKTELLIHILNKIDKDSILVFTRTKHNAVKVSQKLEKAGFLAESLQGNLSQNKRQKAMKDFRDGSLQILVATDIVSRGIDVTSISHVINYDIPSTVEAYIHRIGRTGRAAKEGEAFTLITQENLQEVRAIERVLGKKIEQYKFDDFDYGTVTSTRNFSGAASDNPARKKKRRRRKKNYSNEA